jgi:diacylglycerol O-acyltransferase / wax synthase
MPLDRLTPLDVSNRRVERRGLPVGVAALAILDGALLEPSGELAVDAIRATIEELPARGPAAPSEALLARLRLRRSGLGR